MKCGGNTDGQHLIDSFAKMLDERHPPASWLLDCPLFGETISCDKATSSSHTTIHPTALPLVLQQRVLSSTPTQPPACPTQSSLKHNKLCDAHWGRKRKKLHLTHKTNRPVRLAKPTTRIARYGAAFLWLQSSTHLAASQTWILSQNSKLYSNDYV